MHNTTMQPRPPEPDIRMPRPLDQQPTPPPSWIMVGLRWAVDCSAWLPSRQEWLTALAHIQPEELERISNFVFQKDAKLALVGRLLMRAALSHILNTKPAQLQFTRGKKGKPLLISSDADERSVGFNVSHQGDYTVLAAQTDTEVGVDVMQLSTPRGQDIPSFFQTMRRQFTVREWGQIETPYLSRQAQLHNFYRFWCLKESFIKAEGSGLSYGLQNLEFVVEPDQKWPPKPRSKGNVCLVQQECCMGTKLFIKGKPAPDKWTFQETMLNQQHCVAVAIGRLSDSIITPTPTTFSQLTIHELLGMLHPPTPPTTNHDDLLELWEQFRLKKESPSL